MGADNIEVRFSASGDSEFVKLESLFADSSAEYFSNCVIARLNGDVAALKFERGSKLQINDLVPLYRYIAAHCDRAPSLRCWSSATGGQTFLANKAGEPEWGSGDEPLKGLCIATTGGRLFDHGHLESKGAVCSEELTDGVNLVGFGENGNAQWLDTARRNEVSVVSEEELEDMANGWHLFPPSTGSLKVLDAERVRLRGIDTAKALCDYIETYEASTKPVDGSHKSARAGFNPTVFFGLAVLLVLLIGFGFYWVISALVGS